MNLVGPCHNCKRLCEIPLGVDIPPDRVQLFNAQTGQQIIVGAEQYAHQILSDKGNITCGVCNARANYTTA